MASVSNNLWGVLGPYMHDNLYMRRVQLVNGEDGNGLELWRRLYSECEGGAEQAHLAGITRFMTFETCPGKKQAQLLPR